MVAATLPVAVTVAADNVQRQFINTLEYKKERVKNILSKFDIPKINVIRNENDLEIITYQNYDFYKLEDY